MSTFNTALPTPEADNIFRLQNNQEYLFDVMMYNANDEFVRLRNQNINEFVLEDNFLDFYHKGYLVFRNDQDALESLPTNPPNSNSAKSFSNFSYVDGNKVLPFSFRGDSRDFLIVDIIPKLNNQSFDYNYGEEIEKVWRLKFVFSIYNTEDIIIENQVGVKYKKIYFWDFTYQLLREKNSDFSTANFVDKEGALLKDNSERGIKTGLAIKNLLKNVFPKDEGYKTEFEEDFDEGYASIFYSSPTDQKSINDLEYLVERHVSSPGNNFDFCILRRERFTNNWSFRSLKDYFSKAYNKAFTTNADSGGSFHLEKFMIGNYSDTEASYNNISRTPTSYKNIPSLPDYSYIEDFRFSPPAGFSVQDRLVSKMIHTYDYNEKEFIVDVQENNFEKNLDIYKKNYIEGLKGDIGANPFSSLTKNYYRVANKNYDADYAANFESKEQRLYKGRNDFLKNALFLNNTLNFTCPGLTFRQAGRFISVDRQTSIPESKFDNKLLGIYFVVNVRHVFRNSSYKNEITCVKPYIFNDPKNNELIL